MVHTQWVIGVRHPAVRIDPSAAGCCFMLPPMNLDEGHLTSQMTFWRSFEGHMRGHMTPQMNLGGSYEGSYDPSNEPRTPQMTFRGSFEGHLRGHMTEVH